MEGPQFPPLKTRSLIRSCQVSRLGRELLAHAYHQVCPEILSVGPRSAVPDAAGRKPGKSAVARRRGGRSVGI